MANETAIGWTDLSWNPVHGCSVVSPGCAHCYAATLSLQRGHTSKPWTPQNAAENVLLKPKKLREPFSGAKVWRGLGDAAARAGKTDGKLVFVNSMSDLFHEEVPDEFIAQVWATMMLAEKHTFQVLTKRPERMHALLTSWSFCKKIIAAIHASKRANAFIYGDVLYEDGFSALTNIWLGVSIENRRYVDRADVLRETPAAVRFISAEPLLGPLVKNYEQLLDPCGETHQRWSDGSDLPDLDLTDIDWLIVGGESGPGHRPMREEWVRDLRKACRQIAPSCDCQARSFGGVEYHERRCASRGGTAFFVKQGSGPRAGQQGDLPDDLWRFKEFPQVREAVLA
jgi:protein gp37